MSIPEPILNQIKCCQGNDGHIAIEPVLLNCGGHICKQCISESSNEISNCLHCKSQHNKRDLLNSTISKLAEITINSYLNDLFQYIETMLKSTLEDLKGF